jgi:hypothetical protein
MIYDLEGLVNAAIALNQRNRPGAEIRQQLSSAAFAFEFCTVQINVGRRSGKSSVIAKISQSDDVIITHNQDAAINFRKGQLSTPATVLSAGYIGGQLWLGKNEDWMSRQARRIFIDEPYFVNRVCPLEQIYSQLVSYKLDQTFILLGA